MTKISYAGYRFPPDIIQQAIWLYVRFTLSFRDVEDLLAERGIMVSYETVRRWVNHFGPKIAADLHKRRPKPHTTWHLGEVYLKFDGRLVYLWRAVDAEGEVVDVLVQTRRNKRAALRLMRNVVPLAHSWGPFFCFTKLPDRHGFNRRSLTPWIYIRRHRDTCPYFNLLDARGIISVTERQSYIHKVSNLAKACGAAWLKTEAGGA